MEERSVLDIYKKHAIKIKPYLDIVDSIELRPVENCMEFYKHTQSNKHKAKQKRRKRR